MLRFTEEHLEEIERQYPGLRETVHHCEEAALPSCAHCGSADTAAVGIGIVGYSIHLAAATTKYKLLANGPAPGAYFCNACERFFGPVPELRGGTPDNGCPQA